MDVTLVNGDFPSVTPVPPLGLMCLVKAAELHGHRVSLRDYQFGSRDGARSAATFAAFCRTEDRVLGISASGFALPCVVLATQELKREHPDQVVVLGGIGASGAAEQIMRAFPWVDAVVCGEGEETFPEYLECLDDNREPAGVRGLVYRRGDSVRVNPGRRRLADFGAYHSNPPDLALFKGYRMINVIASRGCPYPCTFCDVAPYWHRTNIRRPIGAVVEEVAAIARMRHPTPRFVFVDDTLTIDRARVVELCEGLIASGIDVEWGCYARADTLDAELLEAMGKARCGKVYLGLESGSDSVLRRLRKGFDAECGRRAAVLATQHVPIVQTSFVWGYPFESWDEFYDTVMLMMYLVTKGVSVKANVLTPLPFSALFAEYEPSLRFDPEYSPQLHLAGYENRPEIVELIRRYPRVFPCFYFYDSPLIKAKFDLMRTMRLSPEHIWDLWEVVKGAVPANLHSGGNG